MSILGRVSLCLLLAATPGQAQEMPSPGVMSGAAGAFLSARVAVSDNDFAQIAASHDRLLEADPDNPGFLELSMQGHLLSGNFDRAAERAAQIVAQEGRSSTASLVLQADAFKRGAYDVALGALEDGQLTGPLTDPMAQAWAELGRGSMSDALAAFDEVIAEREELAPFALYFKALAFAYVGDLERAEALLTGEAEGPIGLTRRGVIAHISILSQLGRMEDALALTDAMFGANPDEDVAYLRAALEEGRAIPFDTITSARDGMAETYFMLASALPAEANDWLPLVYAQLALALRPDHGDAILLTGQILERAGQYALADAVYDSMSPDSPQYLGAQLGKANALARSGEVSAAIDSLRELVQEKPDSVLVYSALGDLLRREEQFAEAEAAYSNALGLLDTVEDRHWVLIYTRAIALERMGEWERAEPEFRRALEFVPDEPQVLNYLGYSLIDKGLKLDEALGMIERAVEAEPDSGYIVDSLGWAFYRLGRYDEAVPVMERAVELMPTDPILNDHLGDVYWAVGREREARFQWQRALSFAPHPDLDVDLVRRKIEEGKIPPEAMTDSQ
ncbi:tetratricopeptide repeat protein [Roseibaca sp. Y0-43]|uniref:tetratricopeptide repeat protein n=1 Tax=Roseibaca sp. Y0-43 TaxID=2816854 RepID=UPI001D0CAEB4|nr:tetratricopeptide repeat protein [Roseibaca sp. Y0-43]